LCLSCPELEVYLHSAPRRHIHGALLLLIPDERGLKGVRPWRHVLNGIHAFGISGSTLVNLLEYKVYAREGCS